MKKRLKTSRLCSLGAPNNGDETQLRLAKKRERQADPHSPKDSEFVGSVIGLSGRPSTAQRLRSEPLLGIVLVTG
jgi:hypothetical protein